MKSRIKSFFGWKTFILALSVLFYLSSDAFATQNLSIRTLEVALSSDTPRGTNIPYDSPAIPFTTIELTASDDADVEISSMTFARPGFGDNNDFGTVWLEVDGSKRGSGTTMSQDGTMRLVFNPRIVVLAGQTIQADLMASLGVRNIGSQNQFSLVSSNSIISSATTIIGAFPIKGEEMTTENYRVTELKFTALGSDTNINIGDTSVEIGKFSLDHTSNTEKAVEFNTITFKNNGTLDLGGLLGNATLYVSGEQVSAETVIDGDSIMFNLNNGITGGYIVDKGESIIFSVQADIVSAAKGSSINLKIEDFKNVIGLEIGTDFGVNVKNAAGFGLANLKVYKIKTDNLIAEKEVPASSPDQAYTMPERADPQAIKKRQDDQFVASHPKQNLFIDLEPSHKNHRAIEYLKNKKIIEGYEDGSFKPSKTVNRAELLKIIVASKNLELDSEEYRNCFPDVETEWFAPFVCYAKSQGWVKGYEDGTFQPAKTVSKVEGLKMLLEAYDQKIMTSEEKPFEDVETNFWFAPYVKAAKEKGLLEEKGRFFSPGNGHTRSGVAENLYRLMQ